MKTTKNTLKEFWKNFPTFSKLREKEKQIRQESKAPALSPKPGTSARSPFKFRSG